MPIIIKNSGKNRKGIFLDSNRLSKYITVSKQGLFRLTKYFPIEYNKTIRPKRKKIDRNKLAEEYILLLKEGTYKNRAELAKAFGVSRAWITKVMNKYKT